MLAATASKSTRFTWTGSQLALTVFLTIFEAQFPTVKGGSDHIMKEHAGVFYQCPEIKTYNCTFNPEEHCGFESKYKIVLMTWFATWHFFNPSFLRYRRQMCHFWFEMGHRFFLLWDCIRRVHSHLGDEMPQQRIECDQWLPSKTCERCPGEKKNAQQNSPGPWN